MQDYYARPETAGEYVEQRFTSELGRLLHDCQVRAVNRLVGGVRPAQVLEIAAGPARLTRAVHVPDRLVCLDYNQAMIEAARRVASGAVRWVRGNGFALPFKQEFDFVYSFRFIRHFHRADRDRLYAQIHRVLRPGGLLMFDAVNGRVSRPLREAHPDQYPVYDKLYDAENEIRSELACAGFEVIRAEPVQRWYAAQYRAEVLLGPRSRLLCRLAIRLLERLRRGPALEWIVTCRRG